MADDSHSTLFHAAFHGNAQGASFARLSDGLLIDVNDAWLAMTGFERSEVLGKTTIELGLWESTARREEILQGAGDGSILDGEITMITRQGLHRMVRFNGTRFVLNGESHVLGFIADVTGERASSEDLRHQLNLIERLTSRAPSVLFQYRLRPDGSSHFPYVSKAMKTLFGLEAADVMADAKVAFQRIHPEDLAAMHRTELASARDLTPWKLEFRVTLADGTCHWLYGDCMPQRMADGSTVWYGAFSDVTWQRERHEELQQARKLADQEQANLQIALDNMQQGILTLAPDASIRLFNQRLLELLNIDADVMARMKDGAELLAYQRNRGDFGQNYDFVESRSRPLIADQPVEAGPDQYLRRTRNGKTLEVKSRRIADGSIVRTFSDVTHFVEAQAALFESEERFRSLTELSSDWYWEQDEQFRFIAVMGATARADVGFSTSMLGKTWWESGVLGVSDEAWTEHKALLQARQVFRNFELMREDPQGHAQYASVSGMPIHDADGNFRGYRGIGRDITDQKKREEENLRLAFYDTLTGLPNRRLLLDRLGKARAVSSRTQEHGALLFIDLDNFKDLNDTQGHDMGDQLLQKVATRLVTCVRQGDTVARFGGDEFVVMLESLDGGLASALGQAETVGQKILSMLNMPYDLMGKSHYSTPSIGIALFQGQSESVEELLKQADLAMYQSKSAGRNTIRFFNPALQATVARRAALETDLREAIDRQQLQVHYQGIVDAKNRLVAVEALARWTHAKRGVVPPTDFVPLAEQTGLILPLGKWILRSACMQLVGWKVSRQTRGLTVGVNISAREFHRTDFVEQTIGLIRDLDVNPNLIKLELTESLLLSDTKDAVAKISALRDHGVRFALDDFGTGYSSLSYLRQLPLDELKIDQSFVRDVLTDANDAAIARTVVALAHSLGLQVVAEGVETEGQRNFLLDCGCGLFQGYLFGEPVAADALDLRNIADPFAGTLDASLY